MSHHKRDQHIQPLKNDKKNRTQGAFWLTSQNIPNNKKAWVKLRLDMYKQVERNLLSFPFRKKDQDFLVE